MCNKVQAKAGARLSISTWIKNVQQNLGKGTCRAPAESETGGGARVLQPPLIVALRCNSPFQATLHSDHYITFGPLHYISIHYMTSMKCETNNKNPGSPLSLRQETLLANRHQIALKYNPSVHAILTC